MEPSYALDVFDGATPREAWAYRRCAHRNSMGEPTTPVAGAGGAIHGLGQGIDPAEAKIVTATVVAASNQRAATPSSPASVFAPAAQVDALAMRSWGARRTAASTAGPAAVRAAGQDGPWPCTVGERFRGTRPSATATSAPRPCAVLGKLRSMSNCSGGQERDDDRGNHGPRAGAERGPDALPDHHDRPGRRPSAPGCSWAAASRSAMPGRRC